MIAVKLNTGSVLGLSACLGKPHKDGSQNGYLAFDPLHDGSMPNSGINVPLKGKLPTTATLIVDGKEIETIGLESGFTKPYTNAKTGKTSPGGNPKTSGEFSKPVTFDGVEQIVKVRFSQPRASTANVLVRSSRANVGRVATGVSI